MVQNRPLTDVAIRGIVLLVAIFIASCSSCSPSRGYVREVFSRLERIGEKTLRTWAQHELEGPSGREMLSGNEVPEAVRRELSDYVVVNNSPIYYAGKEHLSVVLRSGHRHSSVRIGLRSTFSPERYKDYEYYEWRPGIWVEVE